MVPDRSNAEAFLSSTLTAPVAVVGNGALSGMGPTIDAFASVIRINLFRTKTFEEHCGSKTTHWCVRFHVALPAEHAHLTPFTPYCREDTTTARDRNDILFASGSMAERIRRRAPRVAYRRFGFVRRQHCETTGFALTVLLLDLGFKPILFGFDGMSTGHYFNPTHQHWGGHTKTDHEIEYLRHWGVLHSRSDQPAPVPNPTRTMARRIAGLLRRWR